jgi:hypothetical protein
MVRAARIFTLFILVLSGAGALSAAFKSATAPEFIGAVLGPMVILSPLWLALWALESTRPRVERLALILNKTFLFLLACGVVAIIFSLTNNQVGLPFLPLIIFLLVASALNVAAINKLRKQRSVAPNAPVS